MKRRLTITATTTGVLRVNTDFNTVDLASVGTLVFGSSMPVAYSR